MGDDVPSEKSCNGRKNARSKVKSGCRTCKVRKVKCDEGRPACRKCVSTGRVCDGYGIWGGGGNLYTDRQRSMITWHGGITSWPAACMPIFASCTEAKTLFEWFKIETAKRIPGPFVLDFWGSLVFQASLSEPAVLYAVLTLSSIHKAQSTVGPGKIPNTKSSNGSQVTLEYYARAIRHLQSHFSTKQKASIRVVLITCVVFVCLELLHGHFRTAQDHLSNGLKVLKEMQMGSRATDGILLLQSSHESIDGWIFEVFSRLSLEFELLHQSHQHECLILRHNRAMSSMLKFASFNDAWHDIEQLLNDIFHLTERDRRQQLSPSIFFDSTSVLLNEQERIRTRLAQWKTKFERSSKDLRKKDYYEMRYHLLHAYYFMASIMAGVCLRKNDESIFDLYTEQFVSLINHSARMCTVKLVFLKEQTSFPEGVDMSRSMVDIGWIPPLYFTALKCRVHRLRLQAIRLIEAASHREGIWDSRIAACVARKVMEIEEIDFYRNMNTVDDFAIFDSPKPQDLLLPTLPISHRLHEVKLILSDECSQSVLMDYRPNDTDQEWKTIEVAIRNPGTLV
ncbi:MAG: hypothetical protein M1820_001781 [Bogoriella megaspora]|nr:MAG: hypothetical protein M1820_001781 [Bogoriella megaspora]